MDNETKALLGKMLGEIYRIRKENDLPRPSDDVIYGLLNGIEPVIDAHSPLLITTEHYDAVCRALNRYVHNPETLTGYHDIADELGRQGVTKDRAFVVFRYLHEKRSFTEVISRLDRNLGGASILLSWD